MARALLAPAALAATCVDAGIKLARPSAAAPPVPTRDEELAEKAKAKAEKESVRGLTTEEKRARLQRQLGAFTSSEGRAKKYRAGVV